MSDMSTGQIVGGIVGGVIGFFAGGPMGAVQGFAIGAGIGGYIDPPPGPVLRGPTLSDKSFQSSAYGVSIPRLYGTIATMGNIIYLENNEYKAVENKKSQGGKGGGGQSTAITTTYYATFAIALADAYPGSRPRRIWAGGKLIYAAPITGFVQQTGFEFNYYDGTQVEADSRMESVLGIGNCPSYEGTAYIIFYDFELTEFGNGLGGCPIKVELYYSDYSSSDSDLSNYSVASTKFHSVPSDIYWGTGCSTPITGDGFYCINANSNIYADKKRFYVAFAEVGLAGVTQKDILRSLPVQSHNAKVQYAYEYIYSEDGFLRAGLYTSAGDYQNYFVGYPLPGSSPYARVEFIIDNYCFYKTTTEVPAGIPSEKLIMCALGSTDIIFEFDDQDLGFVTIENGCLYRITKPNPEVYLKIYNISNGDIFTAMLDVVGVSFPSTIGFCDTHNGEIYFHNIGDSSLTLFKLNISSLEITTAYFDVETDDNSADVPTTNLMLTKNTKVPTIGISNRVAAIDNTLLGVRVYFLSVVGGGGGGDEENIDPETDLVEVIEKELSLAGIGVDDYNLSEIESEKIIGYRVSDLTSVRAALGPLMSYKLFDIAERGYSLVAIRRSRDPVEMVPFNNLIYSDGGIVKTENNTGALMPSQVTVNYIDYMREYDAGSQIASYPAPYQNHVSHELPVVMSADDAAKIADIFISTSWVEHKRFSFALPQAFLRFSVGDVFRLEVYPGRYANIRINGRDQNPDQTIKIEGSLASVLTYASSSAGAGGAALPSSTIPVYTPPNPLILDIPMIDPMQDVFGVVATVYQRAPYTKSVLFVSSDAGANYGEIGRFDAPGVVGQCIGSKLDASDCMVTEYGTQLAIANLICGDFYSVTYDQMMMGKNYVAYGMPGRWEIMSYASAEPQLDGGVILSTFLRGMFGTEQYSGQHEDFDFVVLLDGPENIFAPLPAQSVGLNWPIKAVNVGGSLDNGVMAASNPYLAVNLRSLSPVNPEVYKVGSDWIINFSARTRYASTMWTTGAGESTDSAGYEIDIYKLGEVVRTIKTIAPSVTYFLSQQVSDFGAGQNSLILDIYDTNQRVGRGYKLRVTV